MIRSLEVRKDKHAEKRTFKVGEPISCTDKVWQDRIQHTDERDLDLKINALAFGNWIIKWQDAYRRGRSQDPEDWKYGAPVVRGFSKPKITAAGMDKHGAEDFSDEQLEYLASIGVDA